MFRTNSIKKIDKFNKNFLQKTEVLSVERKDWNQYLKDTRYKCDFPKMEIISD